MNEWLVANTLIVAPIASIVIFVAGFLTSRWTMTKKERKDIEQKQFENGQALMLAQHDKFQEFTAAFAKYINKDGEPTFDDFMTIATVGEKYFYQQQITSDAILSEKVDSKTRDNTLVPRITEAVHKNLPQYYKVLQTIAKKRGFAYSGELKRENYEILYAVVERHGKLPR